MDARVRRLRKRFPAVSVRKSRDRERQLSVRSTETSLSPSLNRRTGCVALGIDWAQNFDHQSVPSASLKLHRSTSYLPRRAPHVLYRSRYDLTNYSGACASDCFFVRASLTNGGGSPPAGAAAARGAAGASRCAWARTSSRRGRTRSGAARCAATSATAPAPTVCAPRETCSRRNSSRTRRSRSGGRRGADWSPYVPVRVVLFVS